VNRGRSASMRLMTSGSRRTLTWFFFSCPLTSRPRGPRSRGGGRRSGSAPRGERGAARPKMPWSLSRERPPGGPMASPCSLVWRPRWAPRSVGARASVRTGARGAATTRPEDEEAEGGARPRSRSPRSRAGSRTRARQRTCAVVGAGSSIRPLPAARHERSDHDEPGFTQHCLPRGGRVRRRPHRRIWISGSVSI
jgi:hypothetical protein